MARNILAEMLPRIIEAELDEINDQVDQEVQNSAKLGRDLVREFINTRPSEKSGKSGRVETGAMRDKVSYQRLGKGEARFGMKNGPEYSVFQEVGFTHNRSGEWIKGMFAVRDAADEVEADLRDALRRLK